jgi:SAM-dependent methyltransferase
VTAIGRLVGSTAMDGDSGSSPVIRDCPGCHSDAVAPDGVLSDWQLARCSRCGLRFTIELPSDSELEELYNRLYSEGDVYQMHLDEVQQLEAGKPRRPGIYRSRIFLNRYRPQAGERLLEVGCGVGTFLVHAQARGWQAEGVDLSESAISASRDIHRMPVRIGSFDDLDFEEGAYGAIVAWEVLEHLPDPKSFIDKARRLLRPDGVLACSVPNEGPKVPHPEIRGPAAAPPVHINFWDRDALWRFFELNGFAVERLIAQRLMLSLANPRTSPMRFARLQAGALAGLHEGLGLFAAARPVA